MTEDEARPIFQQLCEAAAYLHDLGIVHRCVFSLFDLVLFPGAYPTDWQPTLLTPH